MTMNELREIIPEEARIRGHIFLYNDTPPEVDAAIKAYNLIMDERRAMVRRAKRCKDAVIIFTAFAWALMMYFGVTGRAGFDRLDNYISPDAAFWNFPLCISIMALFAPVFAYFGFIKNNTLVVVAASAVLIVVKPYAALLFGFNMLMYFICRRNTDPIRLDLEYPKYITIDVKYMRGNKPDFDRKYT